MRGLGPLRFFMSTFGNWCSVESSEKKDMNRKCKVPKNESRLILWIHKDDKVVGNSFTKILTRFWYNIFGKQYFKFLSRNFWKDLTLKRICNEKEIIFQVLIETTGVAHHKPFCQSLQKTQKTLRNSFPLLISYLTFYNHEWYS